MMPARPMHRHFSTRAFRLGMGGVGLAYLLLLVFVWSHEGDMAAQVNAQLASRTVPIMREKSAAPIVPASLENGKTIAGGKSASALPELPIDGLTEDTAEGKLPKIRETDKLTPFNAYRRPYTVPANPRPTISIAVAGFGLSAKESQAILSDLPPDISVILSPYAVKPGDWITAARNSGHEVWMGLPVETGLYPRDDPGPEALLVGALTEINMKKLHWIMTRAQGYAGLATLHDPTFMKSASDAKPIVSEIYGRGLAFADGDTAPADTPRSTAIEDNANYSHADVWIDAPSTADHMAAAMKELELRAMKTGSAVGFMYATPAGVKAVQSWIASLPQKGIAIAPLSAQTLKVK